MLTLYLISGLLGGILMYFGDMMLYGASKKIIFSSDDKAKTIIFLLRNSSSFRIFIGGIIGPLAASLYIIGFFHILVMALPKVKIIATILFFMFTLGFSFGGAYHMSWIFLGVSAKSFDDKHLEMIIEIFHKLKPIVFGMLILASFFLSIFVGFGWLGISPWYVLITPMVLALFMPLLRKIPQPYGVWIWGGWTNLIFVIYYTVLVLFCIR